MCDIKSLDTGHCLKNTLHINEVKIEKAITHDANVKAYVAVISDDLCNTASYPIWLHNNCNLSKDPIAQTLKYKVTLYNAVRKIGRLVGKHSTLLI